MTVPAVSVVMTTYREAWPKLHRAIDSILAQIFQDFEFIIVFEGEDANIERVRIQYTDPRLKLVCLPQGVGRNVCHNAGVEAAHGRYMARMDGDDYCYPERLSVQVEYLRTHPDVDVLGAAGRLLNSSGGLMGIRRFPTGHSAIVRSMALTNPIFHPAVMWDRERAGYELRYALYQVDDLELWLRMLQAGRRFANLPQPLIDYTQPPDYRRPMKNWRGNFWIRLLHWRLCLRHPRFFAGLVIMGVISLLPQFIVAKITGRNLFSDRIRSIENDDLID